MARIGSGGVSEVGKRERRGKVKLSLFTTLIGKVRRAPPGSWISAPEIEALVVRFCCMIEPTSLLVLEAKV